MGSAMKKKFLIGIAAALIAASAIPAQAQVRITEVAPWASTNGTGYLADWFELTNFGVSAVNIAGWKMDDNSNSAASAVAFVGITNIAAGESVILLEAASAGTAAATITAFKNTWFSGAPPVGLQIGYYTGAGVGLSTTTDAVNVYDASNVLQANVTFGAADATSPFQTFDNSAGQNATAISVLSTIGTHSAFLATDSIEIGSPGLVPEPETYALMLAGLGFIGAVARKRQQR
jgi:hypothetical protein